MRSRTSFFNQTVFWDDCKRYWPLTAGYALLWLLLLPLSRLTELIHGDGALRNPYAMRYETLGVAVYGGYIVAFLFGIAFAAATLQYLTNPRATNGLHALPARRETLYATHWLSGLCCQLAAQLLALLLTAATLGAYGLFDAGEACLMLLGMALPTVFFYSFGAFCMIFTGQILAAPVFYGVASVLVVGVELLLRYFAGNFLYGWSDSGDPLTGVLSPLYPLLAGDVGVRYRYVTAADGSVLTSLRQGAMIEGLGLLFAYAAAGLVFAALGLLVYRSRPSEATGSTVAIDWAKPVFKYGVTFCMALSLGQLLYSLFLGQYRADGDASLAGTLVCMAAAGLLGYFAAEMLLKKSFRVWSSGWKGAAVVTALLVILGCAMSADLTGYEGYVPDPAQVESVRVDFYLHSSGKTSTSAFTSDAETIRLAVAAHRALASDKQRQIALDRGADGYYTPADSDPRAVNGTFFVEYRLRDGRTVTRQYDSVTLFADELPDPASPAAALNAFYNAPSVALRRALGFNWYDDSENDPREIPDLRFTGGYVTTEHYDGGSYERSDQYDLSPAEAQQLFDAIVRDVAAGRVNDSIFGGDVSMDGWIELYASYPDPNGRAPGGAARPDADENGRVSVSYDPQLTAGMSDTIAVLRGMGVEPAFPAP